MKTIKKYWKITWPAATIILVVSFSYFGHADKKNSLKSNIIQTEASIASIGLDLSHSQLIVDQHSEARNNIQPYLSSLFSVSEPDSLIAKVNETCEVYKVKLADVYLDVPKFIEVRGKVEAISLVPFEMTFSGEFFNLGKLAVALEQEPYMHRISDAGMSLDSNTSGTLKMTIKGAFRFFSDEIVEELKNNGT